MKTDTELYQDIKETLEFEPGIDPHSITYSTNNGVVTLNGMVRSYSEKQLVKLSIQRIKGVSVIANDLIVKYASSGAYSDTDIAYFVAKVLNWDATANPKNTIKATVENGVVTLTGQVEWYYQAYNSARGIRNLSGVVSVKNEIEIKPHYPIASIFTVKDKITKEFERHALLDAQSINVEVVGSVITLKGEVQSWAEVKEALQIAWSIPGVSHVENKIIIN